MRDEAIDFTAVRSVSRDTVARAMEWHAWQPRWLPSRVALIGRRLALRSYGALCEVTLPDGLRVIVQLDDYVQCVLAHAGEWEGGIFEAALRGVAADGVIVDIGTHVGAAALRFALQVPAGRVYGFEPLPSHAAQARASAQRNACGDRIEITTAAVSDRSGTAAFADPSGINRAVGALDAAGHRQVDVVALDAWLDARGIDAVALVKVDVEGAEGQVLAGMRAGLARGRYRRVLVELHPDTLPNFGSSVVAVVSALRDAGGTLRWWDDVSAFTAREHGVYLFATWEER
jgi:FkbM family methyltransferase